MDVNIVDLSARRVVGMVVMSPKEPNLVPGLWDQFVPRISEIQIAGDCWGVAIWDYPGLPEGHFAYLAGFESPMEPPAEMDAWDIPAGKYAEVRIPGLDAIRPTIDSFFRDWLPTSGHEAGSGPYLELYPEAFPNEPDLYLYFSLK